VSGASIAKSGKRFVRTSLVFALAGPVIGGVVSNLLAFVFFFIPVLISLHGLGNAFVIVRAAFVVLLIGLLYSLILSIVPAIFAGFAIAAYEYFRGRSAWWLAIVVGVLAGIASVPVYWIFMRWSPAIASSFDSGEALTIIVGSVIASICCWWLVRPKTKVQ
jgi:hypothetical protein